MLFWESQASKSSAEKVSSRLDVWGLGDGEEEGEGCHRSGADMDEESETDEDRESDGLFSRA